MAFLRDLFVGTHIFLYGGIKPPTLLVLGSESACTTESREEWTADLPGYSPLQEKVSQPGQPASGLS